MVKTAIRHIGIWARMIHIYLSMAGFVLVLLFAVTGVTLNHQDLGWDAPVATSETVPLSMDAVASGDQAAVVAELRRAAGIETPVSAYDAYDYEIEAQFHAPGQRVHVIVDRTTGEALVMTESRGTLGLINDLHKGMETGRAWRWLVDFTAVLVGFSALSGLMTLVTLPKRRKVGLLTTAVGTVAVLVVYLMWVPR